MRVGMRGARFRLLVMQGLALMAMILLIGVAQLINDPNDSLIVDLTQTILKFVGYGIPMAFPDWGLAASLVAGILLGLIMMALSRRPGLMVGLLLALLVLALGANLYTWDGGVTHRGTANGVSTHETFVDAEAEWQPGALRGSHLFIISGTAKGSHLRIAGNTDKVMNLSGAYEDGALPTEGQSQYVVLSNTEYTQMKRFIGVELAILMGLPLAVGLYGVGRSSLQGVGGGALLILLLPLNHAGNSSENIQYILAFVLTFLIYMELGYAHYRYARYAQTMGESADFFGVILWFFGILLTVIFFTTFLTAAAFSFHELLGELLPLRYTSTIEYTTIYGQAISVLLFFLIIAVIQAILASRYLAKPVEKHAQEEEEAKEARNREFAEGGASGEAVPVEPVAVNGVHVVEVDGS